MEPHLSCLDDSLSAQRTAESDYLEAPLTEEGISAQHFSLNSEHGEDVSAHESDNWSFSIHGENNSARANKHRPRRGAAARRAQRDRAYARMTTKLLSGLASIRHHRGNELGPIGKVFHDALLASGPNMRLPQGPAALVQANSSRRLCRHFAVGRCTYGSSCRFSHTDIGTNSNDLDQAEDGYGQDDHVHVYDTYDNASDWSQERSEHEAASRSSCSSSGLRYHVDISEPDEAKVYNCDHVADCRRTSLLLELFSYEAAKYIESDNSAHAIDVPAWSERAREPREHISGDDIDTSGKVYSHDQAMIDIRDFLSQLGSEALACEATAQLPVDLQDQYRIWCSDHCDEIVTRDTASTAQPITMSGNVGENDGVCNASLSVDPDEIDTPDDYLVELEKFNHELLRSYNRNRKLVSRQRRVLAESFDARKVASMMRYVANEPVMSRINLMRQLPPECSALEQQSMLHIFAHLDEDCQNIDVVVERTQRLYDRLIASCLSPQ